MPRLKATKCMSIQVFSGASENKKMPAGIKKGIIEKIPSMITSNNIQRREAARENVGQEVKISLDARSCYGIFSHKDLTRKINKISLGLA
jgi:hypothetical protein